MEAGLKVGYETAFATAPAFRGNTRLMLFTDEQPNVGRTDADSFIGMAEAASRRGIGLTTIGVGVQFDATLATRCRARAAATSSSSPIQDGGAQRLRRAARHDGQRARP